MFAITLNWIADEFSVSSDETVTVKTEDGTEVSMPIGELHNMIYEEQLRESKDHFDKCLDEFEREDSAAA